MRVGLVSRPLEAPLSARPLLLASSLLLLSACAKTPRVEVGAIPDTVREWQDKVDWDAAGDEAVTVLSEYLAVDTVNPEGNETRGARYLQQVLAREGIP